MSTPYPVRMPTGLATTAVWGGDGVLGPTESSPAGAGKAAQRENPTAPSGEVGFGSGPGGPELLLLFV